MCLYGSLMCKCPFLDCHKTVLDIICSAAIRLDMVLPYFPQFSEYKS